MNLAALRAHRFPSQRVRYSAVEAMRYALSVGVGSDPLDETQLRMVYERQLRVLPAFATVLAQQSAWLADPRFEVKFLQVLHGEEQLLMQRPLPAEAEVLANYEVLAVVDKGEGRGAVVYFQKQLCEAPGNEPLCTVTSTLFLRGDGGCGSYGNAPASPGAVAGGPLAAADPAAQGAQRWHDQLTTTPNAALLYRLNGDLNPLHADPVAARAAGFERPILHGLCTYGIAAQLLIRQVCAGDPTRLRAFGARFSAPVYPGETVDLSISRGSQGLRFQASVAERNQLVLNHGYATIE